MLYSNTETGKQEKLEKVTADITFFVAKISKIDTEKAGTDLLNEANSLSMRVNGAYGKMQQLFDTQNNRIDVAWKSMWDSIDNKTLTMITFLTDLCNPTCMNPVIIYNEEDDKIFVQSDLYDLHEGEKNIGRVEDLDEFFLGGFNNYDYDEATSEQIAKLAKDYDLEIPECN